MDSLKDLSFSSDSQLTSSYQTKLACQCCSRLVSSQSCFDLLAPLWHEGGLEPAVFKAGFELQQSMRSSHILEGVAEMSDVPALLTHSYCVHCTAQLQGCAVEIRKSVIPRKCLWFLPFVSAMPREAAACAPPPDPKAWLQFNLFSKQC